MLFNLCLRSETKFLSSVTDNFRMFDGNSGGNNFLCNHADIFDLICRYKIDPQALVTKPSFPR
jgi:hypothetical protein